MTLHCFQQKQSNFRCENKTEYKIFKIFESVALLSRASPNEERASGGIKQKERSWECLNFLSMHIHHPPLQWMALILRRAYLPTDKIANQVS